MSNYENGPAEPGQDVVWVEAAPEGGLPHHLTIGAVATMFGVSALVLRYYEFRGLIRRRHRSGGQRVYGWADCDRIAFIVKGRRAGLAIDEVRALLAAEDVDASLDAVEHGRNIGIAIIGRLEQHQKVTEAALAELRRNFAQLSAIFIERNSKR